MAPVSRNKDNRLFNLSALAPFLSCDVVEVLVQRVLKNGQRFENGELTALLPFLDSSMIEEFPESRK